MHSGKTYSAIVLSTELIISKYLFQRFFQYHNYLYTHKKKTVNVVHSVPHWAIFKQTFPQCFNIFIIYFVTLSVFPAVCASKVFLHFTFYQSVYFKMYCSSRCAKVWKWLHYSQCLFYSHILLFNTSCELCSWKHFARDLQTSKFFIYGLFLFRSLKKLVLKVNEMDERASVKIELWPSQSRKESILNCLLIEQVPFI